MYRHEAKKVAGQFVDGEIEKVLGGMNVQLTSQQYVNQKELFKDVAAQLKQLQQKIFA